MNTPKVSIQIPTYNQAQYIKKAIESCLAQDYIALEINIVDDGSTDHTFEVVQPFLKNENVRYFYNEKNLGRVCNYHHSLYNCATGEWAINLDGDDYFTNPQYISQAIEAIVQQSEEQVLFFMGAHVYLSKSEENVKQPNIDSESVVLAAKDYIDSFFSLDHFSHMSTIYNRQMAMESGFYGKNIISSDMFSILNLSISHPQKKIILSKMLSGVWLQHDSNASKNKKLSAHVKNFSLYIDLYKNMSRKYFGILSPAQWLFKSFYKYWWAYIRYN